MEIISIKGLEVYASHGCIPSEKTLGQKFLINVDMYLDRSSPRIKDEIDDTVSYADVCDDLCEWIRKPVFNLIEAAAESLVRRLMIAYPEVKKAVLELEKPNAPMEYHFETVKVRVERERHTVYLGLGSNLGKREDTIADAIEMLDGHNDIHVLQCSALYETTPYGYLEQPDFINACAKVETILEPRQLLTVIHVIEDSLGRVRKERWGPRTIDIDILLFDKQVIDEEDLQIPHPEMPNRMFVLQPLNEIAPYIRHPWLGKTVGQMFRELEAREKEQPSGNEIHKIQETEKQ